MKNKLIRKTILLISVSLIVFAISFGSFYTYWNTASPEKTCASCHEIGSSVLSFAASSHREMLCSECHGTALSNGFHSLSEKGKMLINHFDENKNEKVKMNEDQLLELMENCRRCHNSEYANWTAGGHSVKYSHIFLDSTHNVTEQLNADCLRCHGMFFEGTISDLVQPLDIKGPWTLKMSHKNVQPTIPCMACHEIHTEGEPVVEPDYSNPSSVFYSQKSSQIVSFYDRHEHVNINASLLPKLDLKKDGFIISVSDDPIMRNCVQCHAPNSFHEGGTSDDRTPRGVHEGLSCIACHEPHSNNAKNSCSNCHPAISNCKLDVLTMNTTYANPDSPNNIHWVSCADCHKENPKPKI